MAGVADLDPQTSFSDWKRSAFRVPYSDPPTSCIDTYSDVPDSFRLALEGNGGRFTLEGQLGFLSLEAVELSAKSKRDTQYLEPSDSLRAILAVDNRAVTDMRTSHSELANFLRMLAEVVPTVGEVVPLRLENGNMYARHTTSDIKYSPFKDGAKSRLSHTIIDLHTGEALEFSGLMPHLIGNYGFYGGSTYCVAPEHLAHVAHITPSYDQSDPLVALTTGNESSVRLETFDQQLRYRNLRLAGHPLVMAAHVEV